MCAWYASDVQQLVGLARVGEPDPDEPALAVGVLVDRLGLVDAFWFTSSTSPESGATTSETAFTDSTSPYDPSFATVDADLRARRNGRARRASPARTT